MNQEKKEITLDKRIIFALDVSTPEEAKQWVTKLKSHIKFYKVGLQLFLADWFNIIEWIVAQDLEVMVDLKFFDIPETVALAVNQLRGKGISFTTVHGNDKILKAAVDAKGEIKLLAVTVLTSLDDADLKDLGFQCAAKELVLSRAKRGLQLGCDGVVSSGLEAPQLRRDLGNNFLIVVPGVRPITNDVDDQKRVVTIKDAFLNGADHVVIGRPIRQAKDPILVIEEMQTEIKNSKF
ncbi:MAG: orotidine-5'-phosphate decarboxylase [bacterium]